MDNEDIVTYEIISKLEKLGFDCYDDLCYEPLQTEQGEFIKFEGQSRLCTELLFSRVQKWLREQGLCVSVYPSPFSEDIDGEYACKVYQFMDCEEWNDPWPIYGENYESALLAGIETALKQLEENKR